MQQCNYEVYADTNLFNYILAKSSDNKNDVKKKKQTRIPSHSAGKYGGMCNDGGKMLKINSIRRQHIHKRNRFL